MRITIYNLDSTYADTALKMGAHVCRRDDEAIDVEFALAPNGLKLIQISESNLALVSLDGILDLYEQDFSDISIV